MTFKAHAMTHGAELTARADAAGGVTITRTGYDGSTVWTFGVSPLEAVLGSKALLRAARDAGVELKPGAARAAAEDERNEALMEALAEERELAEALANAAAELRAKNARQADRLCATMADKATLRAAHREREQRTADVIERQQRRIAALGSPPHVFGYTLDELRALITDGQLYRQIDAGCIVKGDLVQAYDRRLQDITAMRALLAAVAGERDEATAVRDGLAAQNTALRAERDELARRLVTEQQARDRALAAADELMDERNIAQTARANASRHVPALTAERDEARKRAGELARRLSEMRRDVRKAIEINQQITDEDWGVR